MKIEWAQATDEDREQSRQLNEMVEQIIATYPSVHTVPAEQTRRDRAEGRGPLPPPVQLDRAVERTITGPGGPVPIRVITPEGRPAEAVYLHLHGGGWTIGSHDSSDVALAPLADQLGLTVVSVGYRLAPEHPFPAGPDDCEAAALWLLEHGAAEFGTDRFLIGGESAGAHLAALTLLRLRDHHDAADRFLGANLVFGMYDLGKTAGCRRWGDRNLVLSGPIIDWFLECFLPGLTPTERQDPSISPLHADLRGLPPALFTVGDLDPLLDDSLFAAARWRAAGNEAEVVVFPESIHGFTGFPTATALDAHRRIAAFLGRVLAPTTV